MQTEDAGHQPLALQVKDRILVLQKRMLNQRQELTGFDSGREKLDQVLMALERMLNHLDSKT